jgi:hypothetical protein
LLVLAEPEICQPPNCWGRIEELASLAKLSPVNDITSARTGMSLESFTKAE